MAGQIDIVNLALTKLGESRITSLEENNAKAAAVKSIYEMACNSEMAKYRWVFAEKQALLPQLKEKPLFGFKNAYALPFDFLKLLMIGESSALSFNEGLITNDGVQWVIQGQKILTNLASPLKLTYCAKMTNEGSFPIYFIDVLATRLAIDLAESLTGSTNKKESLMKEYKNSVDIAMKVNAIQLPPQRILDDEWAAVRFY